MVGALYENEYFKENGVWKLKTLKYRPQWHATFEDGINRYPRLANFRMGTHSSVLQLFVILQTDFSEISFLLSLPSTQKVLSSGCSLLILDPAGPDVLDPEAYLWPDSINPSFSSNDSSRPSLPLSQSGWNLAHR